MYLITTYLTTVALLTNLPVDTWISRVSLKYLQCRLSAERKYKQPQKLAKNPSNQST